MMNKSIFPTVVLLLSSVQMMAQHQDLPFSESEYMYEELHQLWMGTDNSSCLTIDSTRNRGYAAFSFNREEGSYRRVQEGSSMNQFAFCTERYQHIGKYLYGYGKFQFDEGRTKERAWSDVMRTYGSTPFISGSSVKGKYDHQDFDLTAKVGTVDFSGWRFGLSLDYKVGDLSRLRDPRSRSRLLDYKLTPSLSYTIGGNTIGFAAYYDRRKEKLPGLTTVQNNPNLYYYQMSGMEVITGTIGGYNGFSREYVNHAYGAEVQYGYKGDSFQSVNALSIEKATDNIYEQYKREPGRYTSFTYGFSTQNRIQTSSTVHQIDASVEYQQGYADENRPQLIITTDSLKGYNSYHYENLLTYKKRYQCHTLSMDVHYRINFTQGQSVKSYVGAEALLSNNSQKHLLPTSTFDHNSLLFNAEYGQAVLKNNRLWFTIDLGYLLSTKADMALADETTEYAQSVLLKDMIYYDSNFFRGKIGIMYQFPLIVKKTRSICYLKAYAETIKSQHSLDASHFGLTLGMFN